MKFELKGETDILSVFGTSDPYELLVRLVNGGVMDGDPQTVRLSVGGHSGTVLLDGKPTARADELVRRLWAKPAAERVWALAERISYRADMRRLDIVFA